MNYDENSNNKIALVVPTYKDATDSMHPPLGLIVIRSELLRKYGIDATIIDGFDPYRESINELADEFHSVGIQIHSLNVKNSVFIGKTLKSKGCRIFIGGPEVTISQDLHWASGAFDLAIQGFANDICIDAIANLIFAGLKSPKTIIGGATISNQIDYSGINLEKYWECGNTAGYSFRHAPVISHTGCSFRDKMKGGCNFCADVGIKTYLRNDEILSSELFQLNKLYNVSSFFCVGENLAKGFAKHLYRRVACPPNSTWSFFARASEIDEVTIKHLFKFGLREIRLGAESGDYFILRDTAKGECLESIEKAIDILNSAGVLVSLSFILGLPEETRQSLENTRKIAISWADTYHNVRIGSSIISPIPGSKIGKIAGLKPGTGITKAHQKEFIKRFTSVEWPEIEDYALSIASHPRSLDSAISLVNSPWHRENERTDVTLKRCA